MTSESHAIPSGLKERFSRLMQRLGPASQADAVFPLLVEGYSRTDRLYHNLDHVHRCLARLEEVRGLLDDPDAAEIALWFHDAVYDPAAADNELRSALLFDRQLGVQLPTRRADSVHAMIMATAHPSDAGSSDSRFVADIDLSVLALPAPEFLRAADLLRRECRRLSESPLRPGTPGFFKTLLSRPNVYLTAYFQANHEQQARRNIAELIAGRSI